MVPSAQREISERGKGYRRRLVKASGWAGLGTVGLFVVFVRWGPGQSADAVALRGHKLVNGSIWSWANRLLQQELWLAAVIGFVIVTMSAIRGHHRQALAVLATMAGAPFLAVVASRLLSVPALAGPDPRSLESAFPSEHAAVAMATALCLVLVLGDRRRAIGVACGVPLWLVFGVAVVIAGWHRPSEVVAAFSVTLATCFLVVAAVASSSSDVAEAKRHDTGDLSRTWVTPLVLGLGLAIPSLVCWLILSLGDPVNALAAHVVSLVFIAGSGLTAVGAFCWVIRDVDLWRSRHDDGGVSVKGEARSSEPLDCSLFDKQLEGIEDGAVGGRFIHVESEDDLGDDVLG